MTLLSWALRGCWALPPCWQPLAHGCLIPTGRGRTTASSLPALGASPFHSPAQGHPGEDEETDAHPGGTEVGGVQALVLLPFQSTLPTSGAGVWGEGQGWDALLAPKPPPCAQDVRNDQSRLHSARASGETCEELHGGGRQETAARRPRGTGGAALRRVRSKSLT